MERKSYRSALIDKNTYERLNKIKNIWEKENQKHVSFGAFLDKAIDKKLFLLSIKKEVRDYIFKVVQEISRDERIKAVVLFGSVAMGNYNENSDIDLFIITDNIKKLDFIEELNKKLNGLEKERKNMVEKGYFLYISPLIINVNEINQFSPIYLDVLDYGILLFDRGSFFNEFTSKVERIKHSRENLNGHELLVWEKD